MIRNSCSTPELTVIVCSHNGAHNLPIALTSLHAQRQGCAQFEVLVVDDGSTDATSEVAAAAGARVLRLEPNAGLAGARNAGVSAALGQLVAFTDDDCEVDRDWVAVILDAFCDPEIAGVGGRVVPESSNPRVRRFLTANNPLTPLGVELLQSRSRARRLAMYVKRTLFGKSEQLTDLYSVVGANMAFRRDVILALDGFDEAFAFGAEEEDLCLRLHVDGSHGRLAYRHDAVVKHWFRGDFMDSVRRSRAYGRGNARRALKHPGTGLIVYPAPVLAAAMIGTAAVARRPALAVLAFALPLLAYPRWLTTVARTRRAEPAIYPYIVLAQEVAGMVGELDGWRAGYRTLPNRHLAREADPRPAAHTSPA